MIDTFDHLFIVLTRYRLIVTVFHFINDYIKQGLPRLSCSLVKIASKLIVEDFDDTSDEIVQVLRVELVHAGVESTEIKEDRRSLRFKVIQRLDSSVYHLNEERCVILEAGVLKQLVSS